MIRPIRLALACAVLIAAISAPALAQPTGDKKKALELYEKGNTQYNLGRWKQAIDFFTQAYEVYNAPEFLFNIAQAHRQDGNCPEALFFYRRYLANKPNATNKSEVEGFIKELEGKCTEASGSGTTGTGTGTSGTGTRLFGWANSVTVYATLQLSAIPLPTLPGLLSASIKILINHFELKVSPVSLA